MKFEIRKYVRKILCSLLVLFISAPLFSQGSDDADIASLDGIISALYASISGEKGEPRNWEQFEKLFTADAKLIPTTKGEVDSIGYQYWTPAEYKDRASEFLVLNGFHEVEIYRVTESFGPVTHIFSTYESRRSIKDEKPFSRGINSIQLMNDGRRWWILNIYWSSETDDQPLPAKYLPH